MFAWLRKWFTTEDTFPPIDIQLVDTRYQRVYNVLLEDGKISTQTIASICGKWYGVKKCIDGLRDAGLNVECRQTPKKGKLGMAGSTVEYILIKS